MRKQRRLRPRIEFWSVSGGIITFQNCIPCSGRELSDFCGTEAPLLLAERLRPEAVIALKVSGGLKATSEQQAVNPGASLGQRR